MDGFFTYFFFKQSRAGFERACEVKKNISKNSNRAIAISNDFSKLENSQVLFEKFIENIMKFTFIPEKKNCNIPFLF